jgi:glucose dehydrogenase
MLLPSDWRHPSPWGDRPIKSVTYNLVVVRAVVTVLIGVYLFSCFVTRSIPLNRPAPGGAWRLKVIFARVAKYALVTICCQALKAQHIALLF